MVTGAGRGIGAATAALAARQKWQVVVNYMNDKNSADSVVSGIRSAGGVAVVYEADIADEESVAGLFDFAENELGVVAGLVNNAGTLEQQMRLDEMDSDRLDRVFATNVRGSFLCAKQAVLRMSARYGGAGGSIVNVSSVASRIGSANEYIDYAASKGAIDSMTIGLANEVGKEGIRVNAVRPGFIETDIHAQGGEPGRLERVRHAIPLARPGKPEEIAETIVWLLSDKASYCTGAILDCAGGR